MSAWKSSHSMLAHHQPHSLPSYSVSFCFNTLALLLCSLLQFPTPPPPHLLLPFRKEFSLLSPLPAVRNHSQMKTALVVMQLRIIGSIRNYNKLKKNKTNLQYIATTIKSFHSTLGERSNITIL